MMQTTPELIERLRLDVIELRSAQDRTGVKSQRPLRWEGMPKNPNGYRTFGDLADDLDIVIKDLTGDKPSDFDFSTQSGPTIDSPSSLSYDTVKSGP